MIKISVNEKTFPVIHFLKEREKYKMGAVFAVQVRTGYEIKAKEMLCHVLEKANEQLVKAVYALETQTELIDDASDKRISSKPSTEDIKAHLRRKEIRASISNKRRQLEAMQRYKSKEFEEMKEQYRKEINRLEKELKEEKNAKKKFKSVLNGYILIELKTNSIKLPDYLWHLIKSVPLVQNILSRDPIPEEEIDAFANKLEEILEPEVEFVVENDITEEKDEEIRKEIVNEFSRIIERRKKKKEYVYETSRVEVIEKYEEMKKGAIHKVKELLRLKKERNNLIHKINLNEHKKQLKVKMPIRVFNALFSGSEIKFVKGRMQAKDFLERLRDFSGERGVLT